MLVLERPLVAQPGPQLDRELSPVEVALEVEEERLDAPLLPAVVRIRPDRDRRTATQRRPGVDPEGGHEKLSRRCEVRRREAEGAAAGVPGNDRPLELGRPAEQLRRPDDVS